MSRHSLWGELRLEHHDERLTDGALDLAIGASTGAQRHRATTAQFAARSRTRLASSRDHSAISSTRRDDVNADRQSENLRILAKFAQVSDRKTVAPRAEMFTQVLILRILGVFGEVAERLKAAVC
jgi:hypothetical protein